ncbi:hypothetical protein [Amycolatopsis pithecellobii]|nr:hypothetical protein [Amycolatopsis pithecellobii]
MRVETLATRPDLLDAALALGDIGAKFMHRMGRRTAATAGPGISRR